MRISKYKNIFAKRYTPYCSEEDFAITEIKKTIPWAHVINDLNGDEIIATQYGKDLKKANQQKLE